MHAVVWHIVHFKENRSSFRFVQTGTLLADMVVQTIDSAFRKVISALLASMRISIARVI